MLCSPPPATTLASSCAGSERFCAPCCRRSSQRSRIHNRPKTGRALLLHERLGLNQRERGEAPYRSTLVEKAPPCGKSASRTPCERRAPSNKTELPPGATARFG